MIVHPNSIQSGTRECIDCNEYYNEKGFDRCIRCLAKLEVNKERYKVKYIAIIAGLFVGVIGFGVLFAGSYMQWDGYQHTVLNACILLENKTFNEEHQQGLSYDEMNTICSYQLGMLKQ